MATIALTREQLETKFSALDIHKRDDGKYIVFGNRADCANCRYILKAFAIRGTPVTPRLTPVDGVDAGELDIDVHGRDTVWSMKTYSRHYTSGFPYWKR